LVQGIEALGKEASIARAANGLSSRDGCLLQVKHEGGGARRGDHGDKPGIKTVRKDPLGMHKKASRKEEGLA